MYIFIESQYWDVIMLVEVQYAHLQNVLYHFCSLLCNYVPTLLISPSTFQSATFWNIFHLSTDSLQLSAFCIIALTLQDLRPFSNQSLTCFFGSELISILLSFPISYNLTSVSPPKLIACSFMFKKIIFVHKCMLIDVYLCQWLFLQGMDFAIWTYSGVQKSLTTLKIWYFFIYLKMETNRKL